jgi:hypothetical protein
VVKETVANPSHLPVELIDIIRRYLADETSVEDQKPFSDGARFASRPCDCNAGDLRRLRIDKMLGVRPPRQNTPPVAMIVARVIPPPSKLATARAGLETLSTSLAATLGLESVDVDVL